MENSQINEVQELYQQLINAWNNRTASGMTDLLLRMAKALVSMAVSRLDAMKYSHISSPSLNTTRQLNLSAK